MNKQQLASTIWQSANQMRSKIEANEYKDYILGFMFYKYLSDREISFLKGEKYSDEDIKKVTADDEKLVKHISENIGYFIAHEDLFSSWLSKGDDFDVSDVRDALSNFDANIEPTYKKLFENIFKTLQSGLSKLGETSTKQTKSIKALLKLIKRIPMDGKQDYDILGFIYEYLISMFAANAGKKAGEFYTPHEVSVLMSEIVANHLKDRDHISNHMLSLADLTLNMTSKGQVGDDNETYDMLLHLKWTTDYDDIYEELKVQSKDHLIHQPPVKK